MSKKVTHYVVLILLLIVPGPKVLAQDLNSLAVQDSIKRVRIPPPPSGREEKIQGGALMLSGGLGILWGIVNLTKKDPCEDFSGFFCTSNIDEVRTWGAVQTGLGVSFFIAGIVRYSMGEKKAKAYEEWKRKNLPVSPQLNYRRGNFEIGISIGF